MAKRNARAGGIFLLVGILGGFAVGVASSRPMIGILAGTAIGIAAALLVWLVDHQR